MPVDAVRGDVGKGGIILTDAVQLFLQLVDLLACGTDGEVVAGPGGRDSADGLRRIDIHVVPVIVMDDINGAVALVAQILGAPLAQTGAADPPAIAVAGEDRLAHAGAGEIIGEDGIHQDADVFKDIPSVDPFLVIGRGGGDGKIVALAPVPFRIDPVQREGHDGKDVGVDGVLRPGGVDFGAGHVFDIVRIADVVVGGGGIGGNAVVDHNIFRYDYAA